MLVVCRRELFEAGILDGFDLEHGDPLLSQALLENDTRAEYAGDEFGWKVAVIAEEALLQPLPPRHAQQVARLELGGEDQRGAVTGARVGSAEDLRGGKVLDADDGHSLVVFWARLPGSLAEPPSPIQI